MAVAKTLLALTLFAAMALSLPLHDDSLGEVADLSVKSQEAVQISLEDHHADGDGDSDPFGMPDGHGNFDGDADFDGDSSPFPMPEQHDGDADGDSSALPMPEDDGEADGDGDSDPFGMPDGHGNFDGDA